MPVNLKSTKFTGIFYFVIFFANVKKAALCRFNHLRQNIFRKQQHDQRQIIFQRDP